jgi:hypothetical protein
MPDPAVREDVFKFVSVRAPQEAQGDLAGRYISGASVPVSAFVKSLAALEGQENARLEAIKLAQAYLLSDAYVGNPNLRKKVSKDLDEISTKIGVPPRPW